MEQLGRLSLHSADRLPRPIARQRNVLLGVLLSFAAAGWIVVLTGSGHDSGAMPHGLQLTMGMRAPVFIGMWVAMMAGMMFPAAAPMILTFATLQSRKREAGRAYVPTSVFVSAYMAVWAAFGAVAFAIAQGVDAAAASSDWIMAQWPRFAGGLIVAAGIYQLTPLKDVCLGKCRTPFSFLMAHWRDGRAGAFVMGLEHGAYCLGCCWLLFVVLVPLGIMNIAAMAAVTVLVFAEKTLATGPRIARAAAAVLIGYGVLVFAVPGALPAVG